MKSDTPNSMVCTPTLQKWFVADDKTLSDNEKLRFVLKISFVDENMTSTL